MKLLARWSEGCLALEYRPVAVGGSNFKRHKKHWIMWGQSVKKIFWSSSRYIKSYTKNEYRTWIFVRILFDFQWFQYLEYIRFDSPNNLIQIFFVLWIPQVIVEWYLQQQFQQKISEFYFEKIFTNEGSEKKNGKLLRKSTDGLFEVSSILLLSVDLSLTLISSVWCGVTAFLRKSKSSSTLTSFSNSFSSGQSSRVTTFDFFTLDPSDEVPSSDLRLFCKFFKRILR